MDFAGIRSLANTLVIDTLACMYRYFSCVWKCTVYYTPSSDSLLHVIQSQSIGTHIYHLMSSSPLSTTVVGVHTRNRKKEKKKTGRKICRKRLFNGENCLHCFFLIFLSALKISNRSFVESFSISRRRFGTLCFYFLSLFGSELLLNMRVTQMPGWTFENSFSGHTHSHSHNPLGISIVFDDCCDKRRLVRVVHWEEKE